MNLRPLLKLLIGSAFVFSSVSNATVFPLSNGYMDKIEAHRLSNNQKTAQGISYLIGYKTQQDPKKALEIFTSLAAEDHTTAQYFLAQMYLTGFGVQKDIEAGMNYLIKSASRTNPIAEETLKTIVAGKAVNLPHPFLLDEYKILSGYVTKEDPLPIVGDRAYMAYPGIYAYQYEVMGLTEFLTKASEDGNPLALNLLGDLIISDSMMSNSEKDVYQYYSKAADLGNPNAMLNLAYMLDCGKGTEKDNSKAFELMKTVSNNYDVPWIDYQIGIRLGFGIGIDANIEEAKNWYTKAISKGLDIPKKALEFLNNFDTPDKRRIIADVKKKLEEANCDARYPFLILDTK
ncbi:tetratricopeptide repeat protein [Taylorella equigenitalis]|nr:SEL1-like repeat protein [Taylorella equigenitalis]WDU56921.1 SEL1-like repeat protein [Taylorella equigenitalis]